MGLETRYGAKRRERGPTAYFRDVDTGERDQKQEPKGYDIESGHRKA
jgi:hypothetical protein